MDYKERRRRKLLEKQRIRKEQAIIKANIGTHEQVKQEIKKEDDVESVEKNNESFPFDIAQVE